MMKKIILLALTVFSVVGYQAFAQDDIKELSEQQVEGETSEDDAATK